ncbi:MAG: gas vesicle structural protein GvpA [Actinomycetota bacterium]|nr:gas vesicle structural protein GvpA [Actinomycetota bacterium]
MAQSMQRRGGGGSYVQRSSGSGLYDVLDLILDKGLVIDIYIRVSLIGIEILTIDARIVIASVDTYLRFAEAVNRLDLAETGDSKGLPEMVEDMTSGGASSKTKGVIEGAKESLFGSDDDDDEKSQEPEKQPAQRRRSSGQGAAKRRASSRASGTSGGSSGRS